VSADTAFRFVQFELPWAPGPAAGRYVIREHLGEPPGHVVVVRELSTTERRRPRRRPRSEESDPTPREVATWRITIIDARALAGTDAAADWLRRADHEAVVADAVQRLSRVLHLHRIAAADPQARSLSPEQALVVRVGYGSGEQVADATWDAAVALSAPKESRRPRTAALRPQERLAALLGGRDAPLACEELALRTRSDLDAGREREAALQLQVALRAGRAELQPWRDAGDLTARLAQLDELQAGVDAAAARALEGGLARDQAEDVSFALQRLEAALRARTVEAMR
jgi:hypothetical protein